MFKLFLTVFVLLTVNCIGQNECLCTFGNHRMTCIPDSVIDLPSGLKLAICGTIIHTKGLTFFTDLSLSYCGKQNGQLVDELPDNNWDLHEDGLDYINDTCQLFIEADTITIIKMKYLPVGENFEFYLIPFSYEGTFKRLEENHLPISSYNFPKIFYNNIKLLSDPKIQKVWHIYDEMKASNSTADKRLAGLLFMAAISGSEELEHKLRTLKDEFMMDNDTKIYHQDLLDLLSLWKN
jgi:hypothetical protein